MDDLISRQAVIELIQGSICDLEYSGENRELCNKVRALPSAEPEIIRCKDCKHNPTKEWLGCPMSHLSAEQRPEDAWCWKGERE